MIRIILPVLTLLIGFNINMAKAEYTGNVTIDFSTKFGDALFHFDKSKKKFERLNLKQGEKSTNESYTRKGHQKFKYRYEYKNKFAPWLSRGIIKMWEEGWTGKDITIGIFDNFQSGGNSYNNYNTHGQQMETIIKGGNNVYAGVHKTVPGVAPEVTIKRLNSINQIDDSIDIINMSQGLLGNFDNYSEDHKEALLRSQDRLTNIAKENDILLVSAAGNNNFECDKVTKCNISAASQIGDYKDGEYKRDPYNTTIVAGVKGYGTHAGLLRYDYVVTKGKGPFEQVSTSASAAKVSGAAALLKQKFPNLTAGNVKTLLLETASGLGACKGISKRISCVDEEFGHGQLNIRSALSPIGRLK